MLADGMGYSRPWLRLPFFLVYGIGYVMEVVYGLLQVKSRPLLTRHAVYLLGRDQYFPVNKAKRDFHYQQRKTLQQQGIQESLDWLRTLDANKYFKNKNNNKNNTNNNNSNNKQN